MSSLRTSSTGLALVALASLMSITASAQDVVEPLTAARSREIQSQLRAIDADRATFVNELFAQWSPYVDSLVYDIWDELGPTAMRVPAWQLRGASMAGDFTTMVHILRGVRAAGRYNALPEAQPKTAIGPLWTVPDPDKFTDTTDQLVFVPIAPCRVVDTRSPSGARVGIISAGTSRDFDLEVDAFSSGQGATGPCASLPALSYAAWAVNVTAVNYTGTGWLTAWAYAGTEPNASIINYAGGGGAAVANGLILPGCYGCTDDITVKASAAATHVIIDVVGYFRPADTPDATVTRFVGTATPITADTPAYVYGGDCPAGTTLVGGEVQTSGVDVFMGESRQNTATRWWFYMINKTGSTVSVTAYSRCLDTPIIVP